MTSLAKRNKIIIKPCLLSMAFIFLILTKGQCQITDKAFYFNSGLEELNKGRYLNSILYFDEAIKLDSTYTKALNQKGRALTMLKKYREAINTLSISIRLDSSANNYKAFVDRSLPFIELEKFDSAFADCNTAVKYYDTCLAALVNRGICFTKQKKYLAAEGDLRKAIEINPMFEKAYNNLGMTLARQERYAESIENYDKAISLKPFYPIAYYRKGYVLIKMNNEKEAFKCFSKAIEQDSLHPEAHYFRGLIYFNLYKDEEKGCKDIRKAYQLGIADAKEVVDLCNKRK